MNSSLDEVLDRLAARDADGALRALAAMPAHDPAVACATADALHIRGDIDAAIMAYRQAVALGSGAAWRGLGTALLARKAFGEAAAALRRAEDTAEKRFRLGSALFQLGRVDEAVAAFRAAASGGDAEYAALARESLACILPGASATQAEVLAARRAWIAGLPMPAVTRGPWRRPGKTRVGYMSAFFGAANWMKPVFAVINRHDRARFEIHMFSDGADPCADAGYVDHDADVVHRIAGLDNDAAAAAIARADIDVLVDLNGYSVQRRLPVALCRPARAVVGWFNMFATTGSDAYDALVGDAAVLRPYEAGFYAEPVHRVPGSYLAFEVAYPVPEVAVPPCVAAGRITFGCLGSQYKLTDVTLSAWRAVLEGAPETRLVVRNAALSDESTRADVMARLGVDGERVTLLGRADHAAFLRTYDQIDIALDTLPYNGGTTTTEALWQGVPVLTFDGDRWASRTSTSLLLAAGMAEWVRAGRDDYVAEAVRLARDPGTAARLVAMRAGMRAALRESGACDCAGLCRALEGVYEGLAWGGVVAGAR